MNQFLTTTAAAGMLLLPAQGIGQTLQPGHARTEFHFRVDLSYDLAFPLFGAWAEQQWAADWKPEFIYPLPAVDREGAVFRVARGSSHSSIWTLTRFDASAGRVQYVYVLDQSLVTKIDITVTRDGDNRTAVTVTYERTALTPDAHAHLAELAKHDAVAGEEWRDAINNYARGRGQELSPNSKTPGRARVR